MKPLLLLLVLSASTLTFADVIFERGLYPLPGGRGIVFRTNQSGQAVYGFAGHSRVEFTNNYGLSVSKGSSIASSDLRISVPGGDFSGFILDAMDMLQCHMCNFNMTIEVITNGQDDHGFNLTLWGTSGARDNYLTVTTTGRTRIEELMVYDPVPTLKGGVGNMEIAGVSGEQLPTPEPGTLALLGSGLVGVGATLRRKLLAAL